MNREALDRPFEAELVKTRRGAGGKALSYVEGAEYIRRLNEAFEGAWSFEVVFYDVLESEVIVHGRLRAEGQAKEQFGGHARRENSELGDDLKSASTDALKKCASLFGVGLHLYSDAPEATRRQRSQPRAAPTVDELQDRVMAVAKERGVTMGSIDMACRKRYGFCFEELEAKDLMDVLRRLGAKERAA